MKCWMLVVGNLQNVSLDMANQLAHATFGFHPTDSLAIHDKKLTEIFRPILFTEKKDWVNVDSEKGMIGFLFKIKPSDDVLQKLGKLWMDIFQGCTLELQEGNYNET